MLQELENAQIQHTVWRWLWAGDVRPDLQPAVERLFRRLRPRHGRADTVPAAGGRVQARDVTDRAGDPAQK